MTALMYVGAAIAGGLGMYFGISGAFELIYYRARREQAAAWKCQPRRWLSPTMLRQQLLLGTANVLAASIASGLFAAYLAGGGRSAVYFDWRERGLPYTLAATVFYFLLTDAGLYWAHRLFHRPILFRYIHRLHHRFVSPNAFTAMAMHPVELVVYQSIMLLPLFVLPLHVGGLIFVLVFQNYVGMLDHSGVDLHSWIPWQPPTRFHDDHHVHFHVNYGQNLSLWDRLFGTYRRQGRVYGVEVFGGRGAPAGGAGAEAAKGGLAPLVDYGRKPARPSVTAGAPAGDPAAESLLVSGAPERLLDTAFVTLHAPWSVGLTFLGLELTVVACGVLALLHALRARRAGDGAPLFVWGVSFTYGIVMELLSYNFIDSFTHGQFSVMFYRHQLPLYVVTLYPVLQYTSIMTARRFRYGLVAEAFVAGGLMVLMDAPFDILGAHQRWWAWSATDPNVGFRWHDVPVTSYYWHLAFGGILAGLTRAFGRYGGDAQRPYRIALLALPISALTIVLGGISFLPFHLLKAGGVPDGIIVMGLFLVALAVALLSRREGRDAAPDPRLFVIPLVYYAYFLIVALGQLVREGAAFGGRMAVIASVMGLAFVAHRLAHGPSRGARPPG